MRVDRLVVLALCGLMFAGSGCVFLKRTGFGKSEAPERRNMDVEHVSDALDAREAAISQGRVPSAAGLWVGIAQSAMTRPDIAAELERLPKIDKAWAAKLGGRASQIVGDGSRVTELTPDENKALYALLENCPNAEDSELKGKSYWYQYSRGRKFDAALTETLATHPRALHLLMPSTRNSPAQDALTVVMGCEQARLKILATPDPLVEEGLTLSKDNFEQSYLNAFPPEIMKFPPEPTTRLPGCGFQFMTLGEDHMGGGKFGDPAIDDAEGMQPLRCDRFPKPGHRYAAEAAKIRKFWNQPIPLLAKDVILIPDNAQWAVERDQNYPDQITGRTIPAAIYFTKAQVPVRCPRGKTQWDVCSDGGSRVMIYFDAAEARLADAERFEKDGKKNHCQLAAWATYNLAHEVDLTRQRLRNDGRWLPDMNYISRAGTARDENALFKRAAEMKTDAKARFNRCGGKGEPPLLAQPDGSDDWDYAITHAGMAPFGWIENG